MEYNSKFGFCKQKMTLTSMFGIKSQAWYSIPIMVLNKKFDIGSEFSK